MKFDLERTLIKAGGIVLVGSMCYLGYRLTCESEPIDLELSEMALKTNNYSWRDVGDEASVASLLVSSVSLGANYLKKKF